MDITVSGRDFELTDAIRSFAEEKANKLTRYFDRISRTEVILSRRTSHDYDAEIIAHVDGHEHFVAHGQHDDLYAAIDDAESKIERQLRNHKAKLIDRQHHG